MLNINNSDFTTLNSFLIHKKCIKINENLLFVPFFHDSRYMERDVKCFEKSLYFDKSDILQMEIHFENSQQNMYVYGLETNILLYCAGIAGLKTF